MKFIPLNENIVVSPIDGPTKTPGGIIYPDKVRQELTAYGEVLAIGTGYLQNGNRVPLTVKVGDVVMYASAFGKTIDIEGRACMLLNETNLLGICERQNDA